ncbi:hypothetical protein [Streptomyces sp. NPDC059708]|uniref:hypothetical protein n=1 Tax=Streptomyces sp. NPDC059708 TaxID=3346916 RepID=UPI0036927F5B
MGRTKPNRRPRRPRPALKCARCHTPAPPDWTAPDAADWSGKWEHGQLRFLVCPPCHTPTETAEAEINGAAVKVGMEEGGQFQADPVICLTGTRDAPGEVLYGRDHLRRIATRGTIEDLGIVERLPAGTRCVAAPGGVLIYRPQSCTPPPSSPPASSRAE